MNPKRLAPMTWYGPPEEWPRLNATVINELQRGVSNAGHMIDLAVGTAIVTEHLVSFATSGYAVVFSPMNAAASTELGAGTMWAEVQDGKVVVHHSASAGAVRTIGALLFR